MTTSAVGGRWLARHPLVASVIVATGFLGSFQAAFLVVRNRAFIGPEAALGMTRIGIFVGLLTMLLLVPALLLLRRRHPGWRVGDPLQASWSVSFGLAGAVAAWLVADACFSGLLPSGLEPWAETGVALGFGCGASLLQAPKRWLRTWTMATLGVLALCFVPIPGSSGPPGASRPKPVVVPAAADRAARPDVVLVSVDTLRADRLGAYGRSPSITPEMDRIAGEGVVFERGLASSPWTIPSVASLLTGLPTVRHGAGLPLGSGMTFVRSPLDARFTTLAERFAAAGYRTRAVVANGFLSSQMGMDQGFETFANPFVGAMMAGFMRDLPLTRLLVTFMPAKSWGDYRAAGVTDTALAWLGENDEAPLFLWVHYIDPHSPYQADPSLLDPAALAEMGRQTQPKVLEDGTIVGEVFVATDLVRAGTLWLGPEDRQRLQEYYDREVRYTDQHLGRLFGALRGRRAKRNVVAALTADHGEEFWDHGHFEHGHDYYREVTWIPLVFWGPGVVPAGRSVPTLAGLVDVGPTLLELAGLPAADRHAPDEGRSLAAMWSAEAGKGPEPLPRFSGGNLYGLPAVLVEDGPWRFLLRANGAQELYDATRDPQERRNLAFERPEVSEPYRKTLNPVLAALLHTGKGAAPGEPSPEQLEALKALGYAR